VNRENLFPAWALWVFFLLGAAALLLLGVYDVLPPLRDSWPLLLSLVGAVVLLARGIRFLHFGGILLALGGLLYLHNVDELPFRKSWPWLLVLVALLIVVTVIFERRTERQGGRTE
jgi:hypothetical protein